MCICVCVCVCVLLQKLRIRFECLKATSCESKSGTTNFDGLHSIVLALLKRKSLVLKNAIWDKPRDEINRLKREAEISNRRHQEEIQTIRKECEKQLDAAEDEKEQLRMRYQKIYSALKKFESNLTSIPS